MQARVCSDKSVFQKPTKSVCLPNQGKWLRSEKECSVKRPFNRFHQRLMVLPQEVPGLLPYDATVLRIDMPESSDNRMIWRTFQRYQLRGGRHSGRTEQVARQSGQ